MDRASLLGCVVLEKGSVTCAPIRVPQPNCAKTHVYSRLEEGARCCGEIVQEDIVVIDNKSLSCLAP